MVFCCLRNFISIHVVNIKNFTHSAQPWTCSECTLSTRPGCKEDGKLQYAYAVMWAGLKDMAARDAVRENDGPCVLSDWAMANTTFLNKRHNKYLDIGHRLMKSKLTIINCSMLNFAEVIWGHHYGTPSPYSDIHPRLYWHCGASISIQCVVITLTLIHIEQIWSQLRTTVVNINGSKISW